MNVITRTFGIIPKEDLLQCKYLESLKKDHEAVAEQNLKQHGYKLLKKEWKSEILPNTHLSLKITYEVPE